MKMFTKLALLVPACLVLVSGVAYASIPGPNGVIDGCYKNSSPAQGAVVVVDSTANCPSGTTPLKWAKDMPSQLYIAVAYNPPPPGVQCCDYAIVAPGETMTLNAVCNLGDVAVSGGYEVGESALVIQDTPSFNTNGDPPYGIWTVTVKNEGVTPWGFQAYAICARSIS